MISVGHTAMIPAMLAAMLLRFDHYAGPKAAMQQRAYQRDTAPKLVCARRSQPAEWTSPRINNVEATTDCAASSVREHQLVRKPRTFAS